MRLLTCYDTHSQLLQNASSFHFSNHGFQLTPTGSPAWPQSCTDRQVYSPSLFTSPCSSSAELPGLFTLLSCLAAPLLAPLRTEYNDYNSGMDSVQLLCLLPKCLLIAVEADRNLTFPVYPISPVREQLLEISPCCDNM